MITQANPIGFDPNKLAAVLYRPEDDIDGLLAEFAGDLLRAGERIGGVVQRNAKNPDGGRSDMRMIDLMTSREIALCQDLGAGATSCKLDANRLGRSVASHRARHRGKRQPRHRQ